MQPSLAFESLRESGIDYLTATSDHSVSDREFAELVDFLLTSERQQGNFVRPFSSLGYEGFKCGKVSVGTRSDGRLVRVTSSEAHLYFERVYPSVTNVSRIDVQITVDVGNAVNEYLDERRAELECYVPRRGKPPEVTTIRNSSGGMTVQSGKRASEKVGRIYNKEFESGSKLYHGCARFETELHGRAANFAANYLYRSRVESPGIIGLVRAFFCGRGISERVFAPFASFLGFSKAFECPRSPGDHLRSLEWLRNQVRPSVQSLVLAGKGIEVLEALGLTIDMLNSECRGDKGDVVHGSK